MANGRMLSKSTSLSRQLASLKSDTNRMLYTWMIPHGDVAGRMHGDPTWIRAAVVPMLEHLTAAKVADALSDMERVGLVSRYTDDGGQSVVEFTGWAKHQKLRADKEAGSIFGPRPVQVPDHSRTTPGVLPDHSGRDRDHRPEDSGSTPAEEKRREEKGEAAGPVPPQPPPDPSEPKKGTRCPSSSATDEAIDSWLERHDIPRQDDRLWGREVVKFLDHKRAAAGDKGVHRDWTAAWRTWAGRAVGYGNAKEAWPILRSALAKGDLFGADVQCDDDEVAEMRRRAAQKLGMAS